MAQSRDRKILRIGVIQNGKIIEERLHRRRDSVTVGHSPRNTFVLPAAGLPKSYLLFELKGGVYHLNFRADMRGKVSVDDAVFDLKGLVDKKLAVRRGDGYSLTLTEKSRGKVVIDDVTLLFQFVTPPPPPSKLQLPANMRSGWLASLDWPFVSCMLGSFVFQVFSMAFIVTRDYPEPPRGIETLPDRFVKILIPETPPPPPQDPKEKVDDAGDKKEEKVAEVKPEKPKPEKKPVEEPKPERKPATEAEAKAERLAEKKQQVQENTIIKHLGTIGGDGPGSLVDSLQDGATAVSMADAFDGTAGVQVADGSTPERDRRGARRKGTGKVAGLDGDELAAKGAGPVATGTKAKEVNVTGVVKVSKPSESFGTGTLDSNEIATVVKRRSGAIKGCYEKQLKRNPQLAGKIKIQFTVQESGRVGDVRVVEDTIGDPAVGQCIVAAMARWRFPKPDGGSVTVGFPFVFTPSS